MILFAQAVPDSAFIPCVDELPVGWSVESIGTRTDEAVIVFENGAYDANALGTLTSACLATGTESPTEHPSITEHRDPAGTFAFTFDGGCFVMDFPDEVSDQDAQALLAALGYLSRDELRSRTGWTL